MQRGCHNWHMGPLLLLIFIVVVGPLAVWFGADSRIDDRRR